jgi:hypothetical protein
VNTDSDNAKIANNLINLKIPPNSEYITKVNVETSLAGTVNINANLFTNSNLQIGKESSFSITTFAQIGKIGFIVFVFVITLLFVGGIIRTVKSRTNKNVAVNKSKRD